MAYASRACAPISRCPATDGLFEGQSGSFAAALQETCDGDRGSGATVCRNKRQEFMPATQPTVVIACAVFRDAILDTPYKQNARVVFMDYGLHLTPRRMRAAIQEQIDSLPAPHLVLIGFGLCGNGLVGLEAHNHTLVIPRADDCVALFFGSRRAYLREFHAEPGTYYLTPGWLQCGGEPKSEYLKCANRYGAEKATMICDALYGRYRRACFIALSSGELEQYREQAGQVANFCRERWGWGYKEIIGSPVLVERLLEFSRQEVHTHELRTTEEFIVIQPGQEVLQEPFMLQPALQEE